MAPWSELYWLLISDLDKITSSPGIIVIVTRGDNVDGAR